MGLSDVMSHAGLTLYVEIGLVLFMVAFVAIVIRTFSPSRRGEFEADGRLPFDETPSAREADREP